ncbi:MAG TPA: YfhO family protein [Acidimicrobiales bacterium]|nr:YfhO family protein [Acidimicrobiales bacterium]
MRRRGVSRFAPLLLVALAVGFGLLELRRELTPVAYLNDEAFHTEMVSFALQRLREGHDPLTSWFPLINLGSPVYLHYQSLPSIITALLALLTGASALHTFQWTVYLLLATWPISVYLGARLFGLPRWGAAAAAVLAPLVESAGGVGYQWGSYVWYGWGVWTQLWAMWVMPLAWGFTWQAITARRRFALAMLCDGLVVCLHYLSAYMMVLPFIVLPLSVIGRRDFWPWLRRAVVVGIGGVLVSSWVIFPVFLNRRWAARNEALAGGSSANSFGARRILSWLFEGMLFDQGRSWWPVISALLAIGLLACLARARRDLRARALVVLFVVALLAYFGRTTWRALMDVVPGAGDLFMRRFIAGVQLSGLLLAGVGALVVARGATRLVEGFQVLANQAAGRYLVRPAIGAATYVLAALALLGLWPAVTQLADYARTDGTAITYQSQQDALEGPDVDELVALAHRRGGGRIFAGVIDSPLGQQNRIADVPIYTWLADEGVDAVGFTLRSASLMSNPEQHFDDANPADYAMFGVAYLILPFGTSPPVAAKLVRTAGDFQLWSVASTVAGTGYVQVVDTQGTITEDRLDVGVQSASFVSSKLAAEGRYPTVAYAGSPAAPPTLAAGATPSGPPGKVLGEPHLELADGFARAVVDANRRAVVLLKVSYDPGWHVEVDGHPAPTEMVAPALLGVTVGPGRHVVTFTYSGYGLYPLFFALSLLTLASMLLLPPIARRVGRAPRRDEPGEDPWLPGSAGDGLDAAGLDAAGRDGP